MRSTALAGLLILVAFGASACGGGPDNPEQALSNACQRQLKEVSDETSGTPTAKSSDERLDAVTLSECAGQDIHLAPDDAEDEDGSSSDGDGADEGSSDDPGNATDSEGSDGGAMDGGTMDGGTKGGDTGTTAVALDPGARETFATTCGVCHTLSDAKTSGQVGPVLDDTDFDADMVEQRIMEGASGMPAMLLQGDEARGVAEYVAAAAAQAQAK